MSFAKIAVVAAENTPKGANAPNGPHWLRLGTAVYVTTIGKSGKVKGLSYIPRTEGGGSIGYEVELEDGTEKVFGVWEVMEE